MSVITSKYYVYERVLAFILIGPKLIRYVYYVVYSIYYVAYDLTKIFSSALS